MMLDESWLNNKELYNDPIIWIVAYTNCIARIVIVFTPDKLVDSLKLREHILAFKNNDKKSAFAQHLITNYHTVGPFDEIMGVVWYIRRK